MIERTHKPEAITKILLDPSMGGVFDAYGPRLAIAVRNRNNISFTDGLRACVFIKGRKGYQLIVGMLPEGRNGDGTDFVRLCLLDVMGESREPITFRIDATNKAAIKLAKDVKMGFVLTEENGTVWGLMEARGE